MRRTKTDGSLLTDIATLRESARRNIEQGTLTEGCWANRPVVIDNSGADNRLRAALQTPPLHGQRYQCRALAIDSDRECVQYLGAGIPPPAA